MRKTAAVLLILAAGFLTACSMVPASSARSSTVVAAAPAVVHDDLEATPPSRGYKRSTCVVDGEKLDPDRMAFHYKGQELQFCCSRCVNEFRRDPQKYMARLTLKSP